MSERVRIPQNACDVLFIPLFPGIIITLGSRFVGQRPSTANDKSHVRWAEGDQSCLHPTCTCVKAGRLFLRAYVSETRPPREMANISPGSYFWPKLLSDWYVCFKWPALTQMTTAQIGALNGHTSIKNPFHWKSFRWPDRGIRCSHSYHWGHDWAILR